jgi:hypothetical protein
MQYKKGNLMPYLEKSSSTSNLRETKKKQELRKVSSEPSLDKLNKMRYWHSKVLTDSSSESNPDLTDALTSQQKPQGDSGYSSEIDVPLSKTSLMEQIVANTAESFREPQVYVNHGQVPNDRAVQRARSVYSYFHDQREQRGWNDNQTVQATVNHLIQNEPEIVRQLLGWDQQQGQASDISTA